MHLSHLDLRQFRNLQRIELDFADGLTLFYGDNAQGKTNLLEAIYFLATGRSFRTRNERECVSWSASEFDPTVIRGFVERGDRQREIKVILYQGAKRLFLEGANLPRLGDLFGEMNAVLFTPTDLQIIQGGPALRRRFLDMEISQFSRPYLSELQRFTHAMRQRNALLRSDRPIDQLAKDFESYERLIAESSMEIHRIRASVIDDLARRASEIYSLFGGGETMGMTYRHFLRLLEDKDGDDPLQAFQWRLSRDRLNDRRMGGTRLGPHRDDFLLTLNGKNAQEFGSQGQQRSCALALRIAEVALMEERTGHRPVLLLDDLASELDQGRRLRLLQMLSEKGQVFLTTTRKDDFPMELAAAHEVRNGEIVG